MNFSFKGYNASYITAETSNAQIGNLVSFNSKGKVTEALANDNFSGVVVAKRDNVVSVQESGYVEMPYTGEIQTASFLPLVAADATSVKVDEVNAYKKYKVLRIDYTNKIIGFML